MIRAISFDFDHTLYDRDGTYENMVDSFMSYFADYLKPGLTREYVLKIMQDCDRSGIYKASHWEGIFADTVAAGIFAKKVTYDLYYNGYIETYYPPAIVLYDDTIATLRKLHEAGYKVAILTNGPSDYQRAKIDRVNLAEHVDAIVVGGELPHEKPHRDAFDAVCRALGTQPAETAHVGDNPISDVDGARRNGLTGIWMRSVGTWPKALMPATYHIDRLSELPDLVEKINGTTAGKDCV